MQTSSSGRSNQEPYADDCCFCSTVVKGRFRVLASCLHQGRQGRNPKQAVQLCSFQGRGVSGQDAPTHSVQQPANPIFVTAGVLAQTTAKKATRQRRQTPHYATKNTLTPLPPPMPPPPLPPLTPDASSCRRRRRSTQSPYFTVQARVDGIALARTHSIQPKGKHEKQRHGSSHWRAMQQPPHPQHIQTTAASYRLAHTSSHTHNPYPCPCPHTHTDPRNATHAASCIHPAPLTPFPQSEG